MKDEKRKNKDLLNYTNESKFNYRETNQKIENSYKRNTFYEKNPDERQLKNKDISKLFFEESIRNLI